MSIIKLASKIKETRSGLDRVETPTSKDASPKPYGLTGGILE